MVILSEQIKLSDNLTDSQPPNVLGLYARRTSVLHQGDQLLCGKI